MSSLDPTEQKELIRLMDKVTFPAPLELFEAWCRVFGTVCAEVAVIRNKEKNAEIFLTHREDKFFKGWHIPGCTHLPTEKIENTVQRVIDTEIEMVCEDPRFFGWFERLHGQEAGQSPRGYECSLLFVVDQKDPSVESHAGKFFPLNAIPKDLLTNQNPIIEQLLKTIQ